jgi:hypothetical protein
MLHLQLDIWQLKDGFGRVSAVFQKCFAGLRRCPREAAQLPRAAVRLRAAAP